MKKTVLFILLIAGVVNGQIVNIPDANLKAKLIQLGYDTNSDGQIQITEAAAAYGTINLESTNISDITGIEAFTGVERLRLSNNPITSINSSLLTTFHYLDLMNMPCPTINLTGLTNLWTLDCGNSTQLSTLIVAGCTSLTDLDLPFTNVVSLDLTGLTNLQHFSVSGCQSMATLILDGLQIAQPPNIYLQNLTYFSAANSGFTSLDIGSSSLQTVNVPNCQNLTGLNASFNSLSSINVTGCTSLQSLGCLGTQLTTLDVSTCTSLGSLSLNQNPLLTSVYMKNGVNENFEAYFSNNITYVCADEGQIAAVQNFFTLNGSPNTVVNSYCSYVPGGSINTITGIARFDDDSNGCDGGDLPLRNIRIAATDGINAVATFTNSLGNYYLYNGAGNYTLSPSIDNPSYFNISPATATINFPMQDGSTQVQNFCVSANGVHPDVEIVLMPFGTARPGFDAYYQLIYKNKGNQNMSGSVNVSFDDSRTDFVSATPNIDSQAFNSLIWNYSNLLPFETRVIFFAINLNSPTETPAVNSGDILDFTAVVNPVVGDESTDDNTFLIHQTVVNSLDPNQKTCLEGNAIAGNKIGDYLHYNIEFENIGTTTATNIVVKDIIDTAKFDINSLQFMYASHAVVTRVTGNKVEFVFENINLPGTGNNHGNVMFKIKTKPSLVVGDVVSNVADIYFDYNFPIQTNVENSTFTALSTEGFLVDDTVSVYPNPVVGIVTVKADSELKSVEVFDVMGRILEKVGVNGRSCLVDMVGRGNGVYFLRVSSEVGVKVEKVVKK